MNLVVLIKQVPGSTDIKVDPETNTLIRDGVEAVINPFDTYAVEEAVRLKEAHGGTVTVITMGPPQAAEALRQAVAVGADRGILVSDRAFAGADTLATSYTLAEAIKKAGPADVIICGKQTIDGDTGQVGPEIATHLNIPFATYIKKIENAGEGRMRVERLVEDGYEVLDVPLPCLITVVKEINEPRLPSLRGIMAAKKVEIETWTAEDLGGDGKRYGLSGSPTQVVESFVPQRDKTGEIFTGSLEHQIDQLVSKLKEAGVL
ncbi:MAG: electron transfer flavoprotein subunit beta/FixA family protein [Actinomycetota bacterium]